MTPTKRVVHIDGDILVYSCGFAAEDEPLNYCLHTVKQSINRIVDECEADSYVVYLSGPDNFRDDVATIQPYKGNRKEVKKPIHYQGIKDYLIEHHDAIVSENCEADDLLGIECTTIESGVTKILATKDKDLKMIPGLYYNLNTRELSNISSEEAENFFIEQLLTGDSTDNIPGLYRITGTRATKPRKEYCISKETFAEKLDAVAEIYKDCFLSSKRYFEEEVEEVVQDVIYEIGTLLWIRRNNYESFVDYLAAESEQLPTANPCIAIKVKYGYGMPILKEERVAEAVYDKD